MNDTERSRRDVEANWSLDKNGEALAGDKMAAHSAAAVLSLALKAGSRMQHAAGIFVILVADSARVIGANAIHMPV